MSYEVFAPVGRPTGRVAQVGIGHRDLNGLTICELWDGLFRGDEMFMVVREQLRLRFPSVRIIEFSEFGDIHGPDEEAVVRQLPQQLKELGCDAVISAVGA